MSKRSSSWLQYGAGAGLLAATLFFGWGQVTAGGQVGAYSAQLEGEGGGRLLTLAQLASPENLRVLEPGEPLPAEPEQPPVASGLKWRPGHYLLAFDREDLPRNIELISPYAIVRGIQVRYFWEDLEDGKDAYDFSTIRSDADLLQEHGLSLIIQLQYKTFGNMGPKIPAYLATSEYEGGSYQDKKGGWNLRLWDDKVRQRLAALVTAMGSALDSHPGVALVNLPETAITEPPAGDPLLADWNSYRDRHFEGVALSAAALRAAFPKTPTVSYFNSGTSQYQYFEPLSLETGSGTGGPDVYVGAYEHDVWLHYSYDLAKRLRGKVPIAHGVQWSDWVNTVPGGIPHEDPSVVARTVYDFAKAELGSNFLFWVKRSDYWEQLTQLWASMDATRDPAGGLAAACPSLLPGCSEAD